MLLFHSVVRFSLSFSPSHLFAVRCRIVWYFVNISICANCISWLLCNTFHMYTLRHKKSERYIHTWKKHNEEKQHHIRVQWVGWCIVIICIWNTYYCLLNENRIRFKKKCMRLVFVCVCRSHMRYNLIASDLNHTVKKDKTQFGYTASLLSICTHTIPVYRAKRAAFAECLCFWCCYFFRSCSWFTSINIHSPN